MNSPEDVLVYYLDVNDCIIRVQGPWDAFAVENEGPGAVVEAILGKPLEAFIAGDVSKMFVNTMLMSARTLQRTIYRPYRCDSGRLKRFMEMTVVPHENGVLAVHHRLLYTEPLRNFQFVPANRAAHLGVARTKRCSLCNKVHVGQQWLEIEDAISLNLLSADRGQGPWIFGVCPACLERPGSVV